MRDFRSAYIIDMSTRRPAASLPVRTKCRPVETQRETPSPEPDCVFVYTTGGKRIPIPFDPELSIANVKRQVSYIEGCPVNAQMFVYKGRKLMDDRTLSDLCIQPQDHLHMLLINTNLTQVFVKFQGKIVTIDVLPDERIEAVKRSIQKACGRNVDEYGLFWAKTELRDMNSRLNELGIGSFQMLELRQRTRHEW